MAEPTTSRSERSLPNFYTSMGQADAYSGKGQSKGADAQSAAKSGERVQQVQTLLEVVKKMDQAETDPEAKKITAQMVALAQQYMEKVQPAGGQPAGTTTGETGAATATGAGATPEAGAAQAGAA